jgi:hypothetical protein
MYVTPSCHSIIPHSPLTTALVSYSPFHSSSSMQSPSGQSSCPPDNGVHLEHRLISQSFRIAFHIIRLKAPGFCTTDIFLLRVANAAGARNRNNCHSKVICKRTETKLRGTYKWDGSKRELLYWSSSAIPSTSSTFLGKFSSLKRGSIRRRSPGSKSARERNLLGIGLAFIVKKKNTHFGPLTFPETRPAAREESYATTATTQFFRCVRQLRPSRFPIQKWTVFHLYGNQPSHRRPSKRTLTALTKAEPLDLSAFDIWTQCLEDNLDGNVLVDAMLIK